MVSVMLAILNRIVFMTLSLLIGIYHFVSFLADAILEKLAKIRQSRLENEAPKKKKIKGDHQVRTFHVYKAHKSWTVYERK